MNVHSDRESSIRPVALTLSLTLGFLVSVCLCSASRARAEILDPNCSEVHPSDELVGLVVSPSIDHPSPASILHIVLRNQTCTLAPGINVVVHLTASSPTCPGATLSGVTDANGEVEIVVAGSGCADGHPSAAVIKAAGVTIRTYVNCKSPDYDGAGGDGSVGLSDLIAFAREFNGLAPAACHDYNNDASCTLADLTIFGPAFSSAQHCP